MFDEERHINNNSDHQRKSTCDDGVDDGQETKKRPRDEDINGSSSREDHRKRACTAETKITFEEVSKYFYMPITQAARELNVGLTLFKKKCRELGIPHWPHRKMKSLQSLILNIHELVGEEGEVGEARLRSAIEILEQERRLMEEKPAAKVNEKTKKLRQACFKANYKKRRLNSMAAAGVDQHDDQSFLSGASSSARSWMP